MDASVFGERSSLPEEAPTVEMGVMAGVFTSLGMTR